MAAITLSWLHYTTACNRVYGVDGVVDDGVIVNVAVVSIRKNQQFQSCMSMRKSHFFFVDGMTDFCECLLGHVFLRQFKDEVMGQRTPTTTESVPYAAVAAHRFEPPVGCV